MEIKHSCLKNPSLFYQKSFVWLQDNHIWVQGPFLASESISMSMTLLNISTPCSWGVNGAGQKSSTSCSQAQTPPHGPLTRSSDVPVAYSHVYSLMNF